MVSRLSASWQSPILPHPADGAAAAAHEQKFDTRYKWAAQRRRVVGTVVHELLQEMGRAGAHVWNAERLLAARGRYEAALRLAGLSGEELAKAASQVERAALGTLEDSRGRWILDASHDDARSEVALAGVVDGRVVERRVDRTFIDEQGFRWIIDFKTTPKERGMKVESFVNVQMERYRQQMEAYRDLYRRLEKRPVRIGLYFPLLGAWREYEDAAGAASV